MRLLIGWLNLPKAIELMKRRAIDKLKEIMSKNYSVDAFEKCGTYGFLRCVRSVGYDKLRIKVSIDFMEGEVRGREEKEIILIDGKWLRIENLLIYPLPIFS